MIDFAFTAEQEDFRKELRRFQKRIIATSLLGKVATQ